MSVTVPFKRICNFWDLIYVDEIKSYDDSRGLVSEVFRTDDDDSTGIQQCYISETNPFVMRGPHQHSIEFYNEYKQTDNFITWKNRMLYNFYNPENKEFNYFITDPSKIYRVVVKPYVIHSYRNLDNCSIKTMNFPTALFKGKDKKFECDEVRHEHVLENIPTYIILGANGRLGKAITNDLLQNTGFHTYNTIPIYHKITLKDIKPLLEQIIQNGNISKDNITLINCIALTNVQKLDTYNDELHNTNVMIPVTLETVCSELNINFYQISTDYVYRKYDNSPYTKSKQYMEQSLTKASKIIRVSNLFSKDESDTHNIISKIKNKICNNEEIQYDPNVKIFPLDVQLAAIQISDIIKNKTYNQKYTNVFGKGVTIKDLCVNMNYTKFKECPLDIDQNIQNFYKAVTHHIDCTESIQAKFL